MNPELTVLASWSVVEVTLVDSNSLSLRQPLCFLNTVLVYKSKYVGPLNGSGKQCRCYGDFLAVQFSKIPFRLLFSNNILEYRALIFRR